MRGKKGKVFGGIVGRHRKAAVVGLALLAFLTVSVSGAFADAGNPIAGTIQATATVDPSGAGGVGTVTIYVKGQWDWLSHNSDCNNNRAGTGVGIIWNEPGGSGYTVSKGAISAQVGVKTTWDTTLNPVDQMAHPVDRGNVAGGLHGCRRLPGRPAVRRSEPGRHHDDAEERVARRLRSHADHGHRIEGRDLDLGAVTAPPTATGTRGAPGATRRTAVRATPTPTGWTSCRRRCASTSTTCTASAGPVVPRATYRRTQPRSRSTATATTRSRRTSTTSTRVRTASRSTCCS